ncbi:MAG TPA: glucose-1-phosphate thymidylyltransferase [Candidatus Eisenbacteria bacterium]|nr:glucose-1-phosphate thymidylyltransferase [Candidatus Eisenbacteria bacterium]
MKGLILSGGKGTRLRPITHTGAKQLIPVANKPILFYVIEAVRDAGIRDIGIVVGDTEPEIRDAVGDGSRFGVSVTYIRQDQPLGLAHAVKVSRGFLGGDPFVMFLGDNLILDGIRALVEEFQRDRPNSEILLARVPRPQEFGVAELEGDHVVRLEEKPKEPRSDLALVGVYMFDATVHEAIDAIRPSARGELEITDAIQQLIDRGRVVKHHLVTGWWKDTGKLEDLLEANRMVLSRVKRSVAGDVDAASRVEGEVVIGEGTVVRESILRGPLILGAGCVIEHSYVGPFTALHDGVEIRNSEIEHSIVMARCVIRDIPVRIEASLIGKEVRIQRSQLKPTAYRFMVGDSSLVDVL